MINRSSQPERGRASSLHKKVFTLLRQAFPTFTILEEQSLKVEVRGRKTTVFTDILVREMNVVIECHGRQHYEFVEHFHQTRDAFARSLERDRAKAQEVEEAGMTYVVVRFDEETTLTITTLIEKITQAITEASR